MMETKVYRWNACRIRVSYHTCSIHLVNDVMFWKWMSADTIRRSAKLARQIKDDFRTIHKRELEISDHSLIVEIWGHLYYEYYVLRLRHFLPGRRLKAWAKKSTKPSAVIDCGEKGSDKNRFLWDFLAVFKPVFSVWIPRNIYASKASVYKQ